MKSFKQLLLVVLILVVMPAAAQQAGSLESRIERLERLLESQGLLELLTRVEQMQAEMQALRGDIEVQGHDLEGMRKQQRKLYLDIERRLAEKPPAAAAPVAPASVDRHIPVIRVAPAGTAPREVAPAVTSTDDGRESYDAALALLKQGRYDSAAEAFRTFLRNYPASPFADNAQYWLGECFYVTRKFDQALAVFRKVVADYANSSKVPDARLKIGFIQYELSDWKGAREELTSLAKAFPGTTIARLASNRLERMTREGH